MRAAETTELAAALARRYQRIRRYSVALISGLSAEDCAAQAMPDASPQKWHLAHTSWFFETFVLAVADADYRSPNSTYRHVFNSYYQSVGAPYLRSQRGLLTRPSLAEVLAWRERVDDAMLKVIQYCGSNAALAGRVELIELGLQHEQQHQELMRTDLLALMALNPLCPKVTTGTGEAVMSGMLEASEAPDAAGTADALPESSAWLPVQGGIVRIGHAGEGFCFDHELPAHEVIIPPFDMARGLVTQCDYLAFIDDGGYRNPAWWLSDGWDWLAAGHRTGPQYWRHTEGGGWVSYGLGGESVIRHGEGARKTAEASSMHDMNASRSHSYRQSPAMAHLSYYEADAYARWAGARLPTEQEWEAAAREHGNKLHALFGDCWQWTASAYAAYPGFQPYKGAAGEYNGKFMVNQQVLRGSSAYTPAGHARLSYRNFFPASATWQRSGLRLAR